MDLPLGARNLTSWTSFPIPPNPVEFLELEALVGDPIMQGGDSWDHHIVCCWLIASLEGCGVAKNAKNFKWWRRRRWRDCNEELSDVLPTGTIFINIESRELDILNGTCCTWKSLYSYWYYAENSRVPLLVFCLASFVLLIPDVEEMMLLIFGEH